MAGVVKQVTLTKGGTRTDNQETETLRVLGTSPALMDGTTKPVINNSAAAPTQAEFNALLAALRTRGVIGGA
ncbi:hypothetical protein [Streptomyces phaeochromogenes]|uniref:hypothetical protein n=1 Tax=Streptomyces phaeochromogenes TaxID=1923 RepID=UPI002DD8ACFE|nr:hypothetical protein [Streptomyces phaeochromogenes]WRZ32209.1 hypothetical protein OG931_33025 [Streptomyces phaeochromogenes]